MIKKFVSVSFVTLIMALFLSACSTTSDYKGVYEKTADERPLAIPPNLTEPDTKNGIQVPQLASQQGNPAVSGSKVAPLVFGKAHLKREGSLRWLEVAMPIDDVWNQAQLFLRNLGFKIVKEDQAQGVMETDWLENRVNLPTNWFSKLFKKLYDSGLQDSYRIRLERSADNQHTLVFIAHRGMKEVYGEEDKQGMATTKGWEPRQPDPELEAEMLERFAIFLGSGKMDIQKQAEVLKKAPELASLATANGIPTLKINEGFARGWRRIGLALDRLGIQVDDRDRSRGLYFVHFPERLLKDEKGLFADLFSAKEKISPTQYTLHVVAIDEQTNVTIVDQQGQPLNSKEASLILEQIKSHLI